MRILVLYGTTDSQTAKIANAIAATLRSQGASADVANAADDGPAPNADDYTAVIVAASVHASGYQRTVVRWVRANLHGLGTKPTAFVSVCLGVLQHDPKVDRDLAAIRAHFFAETEWKPATFKVVAGALPYTRYNWIKRRLMRRIARKAGGDTDITRDFEYTDWIDLAAFAREFFERVRGTAEVAS